MRVLLVDPENSLPAGITRTLSLPGYAVDAVADIKSVIQQETPFDAVIAATGDTSRGALDDIQRMLHNCEARGAAAILLTDQPQTIHPEGRELVAFAPRNVSVAEIRGRLAMLDHYCVRARAMERDLDNMQRLFKRLNSEFEAVDQEMRLAGRLQSAFLPRTLENVCGVTCGALYRPATFVSGDIYDFFRVDERHVAFYVADAVGHGMAASLLTMFIKNAVVAKRVHDHGYDVLSPDEALRLLNQRLIDQELPNSQFVTACYGLINVETREMQIARAGHPYPLLRPADGCMTELKSAGGLLGLFEDESFPVQKVSLGAGDRLILYTDGLETAFAPSRDRANRHHHYRAVISELQHLGATQFITEFGQRLDYEAGSLNPEDDVTVLVIDMM